MSNPSVSQGRDGSPLTASAAVAILTAFVHAANADHELSTKARFLALDALDVLRTEVA